jgi:hypothetical protein
MRVRVFGDTRESINVHRSRGERSMTEPDVSPRAPVWPPLEAGHVREFTDQPLTDVIPTVGPALGLPEDRMVRVVVASGRPTSAVLRPRALEGTARIDKSERVRDEHSSESPA